MSDLRDYDAIRSLIVLKERFLFNLISILKKVTLYSQVNNTFKANVILGYLGF